MSERSGKAVPRLAASAILLLALVPAASADELRLRHAIELALAHAPELREAAAARTEAEAGVRSASAARRPALWARTGPGYASGVPTPVLGALPSVVGVQLRQSVFDAETRVAEAQARADAAPLQGSLVQARVAVARSTAEAFGLCLQDEAALASARRRADELAAAHERVLARQREGRATPLQAEQAGLDEAKAREDAADWESRLGLDRLRLAGLVGTTSEELPPLSPESVAELGEPAPGGDLERARAFDPQLAALADSARQLERAAALRRSWFQPVIQAEAQYSRLYKTADWDVYYPRFQADSWSIGASIALPLSTGGRLRAEVARARAAADRVAAKRELRERELALAVAQVRAERERARARAALAERALDVAGRALQDGEALAAEGRLDPEERTRRRIALLEAEQESAQARQRLLQAKIALLALRGELG